MKFLKNKKGFAPIILLWLIPLIVTCIACAYVGITMLNEHMNHRVCIGSHCFTPEKNCTSVYKRCTNENGCGGDIQLNDLKINPCEAFSRTCSDLSKVYGGDVYFIVGTQCMSCVEYFQAGSVPSEIKMAMFPTLELCQSKIYDSNLVCLEINSKEDCSKVQSAECVNPVTYEKYCGSNPPDEKCKDIRIGGVLPVPDLWCKLEEWLKSLFLPFKIGISILASVLSWLFSFLTLKNINFKTTKKTKNIISWTVSIILGLIVGLLIWFYWYVGLFLLITLLVLKLFVWK